MSSNIQALYQSIIQQVPDLRKAITNAPYIGPNYDSDPNCKILVIFSVAPPPSSQKGLPPNSTNWPIEVFYEQNHYYPNYSRILDTHLSTNTIRSKIEETIKTVSPNKTIQDIAHCHFILRPILGSFDKPSPIDLDKSIDAFVRIIDILKPTNILFFGNDCLRTISRRSFSKALENKSIENYLSTKGITFATISRRSDYQAKTSTPPASTPKKDEINLPKYKNFFKSILNELNNYFTEPKTEYINAKIIFDTKISPTLKKLIAELDSLNNRIYSQKESENNNSIDDLGMEQKAEFIARLALNNQKNNTTTNLSQLAEELNKAGFHTARGLPFSTTKNRGLYKLLAKVLERNLFEQHDHNTTQAIATTFINEKTGLPWILNEVVDYLINQKLAFYENGILKSKLSHKPITIQDIAPAIFRENCGRTSMWCLDNKTRQDIIEHIVSKQKKSEKTNY